jgi:hypothetical protein
MLTSLAAAYRRSLSSRTSRDLRPGLRDAEIQAQWIARNHDGDAWESVFIMATNLSACHPGDGTEALNRLPGLAEPLLEIDLERELQQRRRLVAAGNWSVASTQYSGSPSHRAMVEALSS